MARARPALAPLLVAVLLASAAAPATTSRALRGGAGERGGAGAARWAPRRSPHRRARGRGGRRGAAAYPRLQRGRPACRTQRCMPGSSAHRAPPPNTPAGIYYSPRRQRAPPRASRAACWARSASRRPAGRRARRECLRAQGRWERGAAAGHAAGAAGQPSPQSSSAPALGPAPGPGRRRRPSAPRGPPPTPTQSATPLLPRAHRPQVADSDLHGVAAAAGICRPHGGRQLHVPHAGARGAPRALVASQCGWLPVGAPLTRARARGRCFFVCCGLGPCHGPPPAAGPGLSPCAAARLARGPRGRCKPAPLACTVMQPAGAGCCGAWGALGRRGGGRRTALERHRARWRPAPRHECAGACGLRHTTALAPHH
jgi:hypothetical protein